MTSPDTSRRNALNTVFSLTGTAAVAALVAAIVNVLMARGLGPDARGYVAFLLQAAYFAAPLVVLAGDRAMLRRKDTGSFPSLMPTKPWIFGVSLLSAALFAVVFQDERWLFGLMLPTIGWFNLRRSQAIVSGTLRRYAAPFLVWQSSILISSIVLFALSIHQWWIWALVYTGPTFFIVGTKWHLPPSDSTSRALRNSAALTAGALTQAVSTRGERILLPLLAGPAQLGLYAAVATATEPLFWAGQALADHRTGASKENPTSRQFGLLVARDAVIFTPIAVVVGVVLRLLLVPVFGSSYEPANRFVLPLTIAALLLVLYRQAAGLLLAHAPERVGPAEAATALCALPIYAVAIEASGAFGAAWGSAIVYAVGFTCATCALLTRRSERYAA